MSFRRQHVSSFTHHFKSIISEFKPYVYLINVYKFSFSSSVSGISIYSNPDGSRFFISLDISSPYINDLIEKVDLVGNAFQLEKFPFFPPSPHFSIFSSTSSHLKTYFEEGSSRKELITREIRRPICGGVQNESNLKEILTAYNSDSSSSETDKPLQKRVKLDSTKRENNENKMENLQSWVQQFIALTDGMEDLWIDQVCLKVGADLHFVNLS